MSESRPTHDDGPRAAAPRAASGRGATPGAADTRDAGPRARERGASPGDAGPPDLPGPVRLSPARLSPSSLAAAAAHLGRRDPDLGRLLAIDGTPPLWARPAGFATLVRIILEQQVSLASARAVYGRLRAGAGRMTPERVLALGPRGLRGLGLTRQKTAYVVHLAEALRGGDLDLRGLAAASDAEARARLVRLKGIGRWTADIYLLMAMRRPDVWPVGDIALASTVRVVKGLRTPPSAERLERIAEAWRPHRSVAARMLWHHYLRRPAANAFRLPRGRVRGT